MILVFVFQQQSGDVNTWATRLAAIEIAVNEPAGEAAGATDLKFKKSDHPVAFLPFQSRRLPRQILFFGATLQINEA